MNIRRGLFRLWVLASLAWTVTIGWTNWERVWNPYVPPASYRYFETTQKFVELGDYANYPEPEPATTVTFDMPLNVVIYAWQGTTRQNIEARIGDLYAVIKPQREEAVREARIREIVPLSLIIFVPAAGLFIVGAALFWAVSGFRAGT